MLKFLEISQFALIDCVSLEFHEGLNLLTGETGSGKSIIVDALGLLLGHKAQGEMIRTGAEKATILGQFEVLDQSGLRAKFERGGLDFNPEELIIKREIVQNGKGRAFVNNQIVPVGFLREIASFLVDIHGQNDQQTLYLTENQLQYLDSFAATQCLQSEVKEIHDQLSQRLRDIQALRRDEQERLRTIDLFTFQVVEIENAHIKSDDEDERLAEEHRLLANADKLYQLSNQAYEQLYEAESSATGVLRHVIRLVDELSRVDGRCRDLAEQLQTAKITLEDAAVSLREYSSRIEVDPRKLEWTGNRIAEIDRLKRKYGTSVKEVLAFCQKQKEALQHLQGADESLLQLEKEKDVLRESYRNKAVELSAKRRAAASLLERSVERELSQLAMPKTRFQVSFADASDGAGQESWGGSSLGIDQIDFLLSPNPGEELKPLAKIASGGEISRIMLALKSVKTVDESGKTLVFDEVDAGIGGQTADVVGQKLKRLSKHNQVVCVTHLPQISLCRILRRSVSHLDETTGNFLRIVMIHLAAESLNEKPLLFHGLCADS